MSKVWLLVDLEFTLLILFMFASDLRLWVNLLFLLIDIR